MIVCPWRLKATRSTPMCQEGFCQPDPDPYEDAPGYNLGTAITNVTCFNGSQTDADLDGLSDFCENNIGAAFAPEFRYWSLDNIKGEAYWAARKFLDGSAKKVIIAYMPAFYRDEGSPSYACGLPFAPSDCYGHNGDSELAALQVYYNTTTKHWVLDKAWLSQHGSFDIKIRDGSSAYPLSFTYPDKEGGYPRIWLSMGKHAMYASKTGCDLGGTFGSDTCSANNASVRFFFGGDNRNVGARPATGHTPAQDCKPSVDPTYLYYGAGRIECFWTNVRFRGWIPTTVGGADSEGYSTVIAPLGF
jgi:hypothetical protein